MVRRPLLKSCPAATVASAPPLPALAARHRCHRALPCWQPCDEPALLAAACRDADQSGTVTKKEFHQALGRLGLQLAQKDSDVAFDEFDPDGSGHLDYKELHKLLRQRVEQTAPKEAATPASSSTGEIFPAWLDVGARLPTSEQVQFDALYSSLDISASDHLTQPDVEKGVLATLGVHPESGVATRRCQPAIAAAFEAVAEGGDGVGRQQFRSLLVYLQRHFELLAMFDAEDSGDSRRITHEQFTEALPKLKEWGIVVEDPDARFAALDQGGNSAVPLSEFSSWALRQGLGADAESGG